MVSKVVNKPKDEIKDESDALNHNSDKKRVKKDNNIEEQKQLLSQIKAKADWITRKLTLVQGFVSEFDDNQELELAFQEMKENEIEVRTMIYYAEEVENTNLDEVVLKVNKVIESIYASKIVKMMMINMFEYHDNWIFLGNRKDEIKSNICNKIMQFLTHLIGKLRIFRTIKKLVYLA